MPGLSAAVILLLCPFLVTKEEERKESESYHVIRDQLPSLFQFTLPPVEGFPRVFRMAATPLLRRTRDNQRQKQISGRTCQKFRMGI
jgi:hypothetical protein